VEERDLLLSGAPDAIFERADGTLAIADYKTARATKAQDRLLPVYRVRLNAYAYIARRLGWNPVTALALIYTEPVTDDTAAAADEAHHKDGFALGFAAKIVPIELDESMLPPLFAKAVELHAQETPPAGRPGCNDCAKLDAVRGLLG
jgi:hypothetical protein